MATGVHGHRRAVLFRAAHGAAALAGNRSRDPGHLLRAAAETPRCIACRRNEPRGSFHRLHRGAVRHRPRVAPASAAAACDHPDRHRPFGRAVPRGKTHWTGSGATGRRRRTAALGSHTTEEGRLAGGRRPATRSACACWSVHRCRPPILAPGTSSATPGSADTAARLRVGSGGADRRNAAKRSAPPGAAPARDDRPAHLGGGARCCRRGVDHSAHRDHDRHPAAGP